MVYSVVVTDAAACDLDSILNYLVEQLHTPKAAVDLMTEYNEILDNLERYPYMFEGIRDIRPPQSDVPQVPAREICRAVSSR